MRLFTLLAFVLAYNCSSFSQTGGETCATATLISSIPYSGIGNTSSATDNYFASCADVGNLGGARDLVYQFTNGSNPIYVTISLCQAVTNYDSQLYVYQGNCTGTPVACQEDGCQSPSFGAAYNSTILGIPLLANTTYYIIVDGYDAGANGNYQLNVSETIGLSPPSETNIPLVLINTLGQEIVDDPKIQTNLKIIDNGPGFLNYLADNPNIYNGFAGIEIRGAYSSSLPQKPYGVETQFMNGNNNNVSLLGMPSENDWILLPNYNDKTFLRNILAFRLSNEMGNYAPRTQLVEVVINNIYQGIYVFTEKIKRDNSRVAISKLDFDDNAGDSLTGGYIFQVAYWTDLNSWPANYENPNYPGDQVRFVYDYPDENTITTAQQSYIQTTVKDFEDALWGSNFTDPVLGYRSHIDITSFIDYFLVNEFARNNDGFKKSRRFHKDKNSDNPLLFAGPVWDFDWALKDISETGFTNGEGWMHTYSGPTDNVPPGWYIRLMQDPVFTKELSCRYFEFRQTLLDTTNLFNYIDSLAAVLELPQQRHFVRWPILGLNVGASEIGPQPTSYAGEISKFKGWISDRLTWMDANMPNPCLDLGTGEFYSKTPYWNVYPNPSNGLINVHVNRPISSVEISDLQGKLIQTIEGDEQEFISFELSELHGVYLVSISLLDGTVVHSKVLRN